MERFLEYFRPEKYVLDLTVRKAEKFIGGKVTIFGEALAPEVRFHAVGLSVDFVRVNGKKAEFSVADGVLTLFKVPLGDLEVEVRYHGSLNENMEGAYLSTYEYEGRVETLVATQFESHYAREAFPCIDEPAAKAVFELSITVPDGEDLVIANMPELEVSAVEGGVLHRFMASPRMSTYLLAFVIGRLQGKTITNNHGVKITTYAALNQELDAVDFANEVAARSLEYFDDNFGVPYPFSKLDQIALPDFEAGAMENWGLVTYRESMLLAAESATVETKKGVALTVAHELSHQWFGDLVTMEWWDDLWLNESFASIMEFFAVDYMYPEFQIFERFFTVDCLSALKRDAYRDVQAVHQEVSSPAEIATLFDSSIVYSKGARLMLMVIRAMGFSEFCAGIEEYFREFQYRNTVGDDLWRALSKHAEFDVRKLMHSFIDKPGYPVVSSADGRGDFSEFSQQRFLLDAEISGESKWPIPEIREDMSGHYILNLSEEEFGARLSKFSKLGLEEKLRLLIDRMLLSKAGMVSSASLLSLVSKFKGETSAAVWEIILSIVSSLKIFFETGSAEEKAFKRFVLELVSGKLAEIGLTTRKGDDENTLRLRSILLALDYYAEDLPNLKKLAKMYAREFAELDAEMREHIFDAKIYTAPESLDEFLAAYQAEVDPEIKFELLLAMTLSRDEKNIEKMISLLEKPEIVKPQDQFYLFIYLFRNPRAREKAFSWLVSHWDYVAKTAGDKSLDNYPQYMASAIRTGEDAEKYSEFFGVRREDPALSRAIKIGENEIRAQLKLIETQKAGIYQEVKKFML